MTATIPREAHDLRSEEGRAVGTGGGHFAVVGPG
jgi:hypothetical protein